jgi:DNA-binding NarL/FixJ family response regulator
MIPSRRCDVPNIRVLIHEIPKMVTEILEEAITSQADMEVITGPPFGDRLPLVHSGPPDVVIVGGNDPQPAAPARALLTRWPSACVLVITARGHQVVMYQLLPRRTELGEMSPDELIRAIRSAVRAEDSHI